MHPRSSKTCPDATYVIVSNPVDILTYVFHKVTDIPSNRIIGTGTQLDTARLRARIAEYLSVSQKNVHAYVFGEHGETSFIPWSIAEVSTVSLFDCKDKIKLDEDILVDLDYAEIERHMRSSGAKVIERKGCTNYAISVAVCSICDALFGAVNAVQHRIPDAQRRIRYQRRMPVHAGPDRQRHSSRPHNPRADRRRAGQAPLQRRRP